MSKAGNIGLVGYGYWGKILYKTLIKLGYKNIVICDANPDSKADVSDFRELDVAHVLIATPPSTHYEEVQMYFVKSH